MLCLTHKEFSLVPVGSTVAVQHEKGGLWIPGTVIVNSDANHISRSYKLQLTKTGHFQKLLISIIF